jgi:arylsulfatase A-like enzyme
MKKNIFFFLVMLLALPAFAASQKPNIVLILADDLGFGDTGVYGATKIPTPNVDRLGAQGLRFMDAHATSATCTPSRYSLLTGQYPWRKNGTGVLPGNAPLIISTNQPTLASILKNAGYHTGVVGKWHLGLGDAGGADWNHDIKPGPNELGFDYSFIMAATGDRVPCVYIENHRVVGLDANDPIKVSYGKKIGDEPTGKEHPELLKMGLSLGHDGTIVDGISRIGFMSGGKVARWKDEDKADVLTGKAVDFIQQNSQQPFFLYFATHDPHVPRVPHPRFVGKSGCGVRGDVIVEFDWCVGQIMATLDKLNLASNTIIILSSDNGPVLDDGYADGAVRDLNGHTPGGPLRGGKYSIYEAGTRVPFILRWPGRVTPGVSDALVCLMDFPASFAALSGQKISPDSASDSVNVLPALLGDSKFGREKLVEHDGARVLGFRDGLWKFVEPEHRARLRAEYSPLGELYDLGTDLGETKNLLAIQPATAKKLSAELLDAQRAGRAADAKPVAKKNDMNLLP